MGIELDAGIALDLGAKIGDLTDQLRHLEQARRDSIPIDVRQKYSGIMPATGNLALTSPNAGPEQGRLWLMRRILVSATPNWSTSPGGSSPTAEVYATALSSTQVATLRPVDELVAEFSAIPGVQYFSNRQIVVQNLENVVCVIVGGGSAIGFVCSIQAEDYSVEASAARGVYEL